MENTPNTPNRQKGFVPLSRILFIGGLAFALLKGLNTPVGEKVKQKVKAEGVELRNVCKNYLLQEDGSVENNENSLQMPSDGSVGGTQGRSTESQGRSTESQGGWTTITLQQGRGIRKVYRNYIDHPAANDLNDKYTSQTLKFMEKDEIGIKRASGKSGLNNGEKIRVNPTEMTKQFVIIYNKYKKEGETENNTLGQL